MYNISMIDRSTCDTEVDLWRHSAFLKYTNNLFYQVILSISHEKKILHIFRKKFLPKICKN